MLSFLKAQTLETESFFFSLSDGGILYLALELGACARECCGIDQASSEANCGLTRTVFFSQPESPANGFLGWEENVTAQTSAAVFQSRAAIGF